jgi:MinD-like ATPase involved in chromosome partitioning or flagellar assembly
MSKIISIHSYRGGTGKSNTIANIAAILASQGQRVGLVDTDIQSPGIHVIFGLTADRIGSSLNDYLWGKCEISQTAYDVTDGLDGNLTGKVFLVPSSNKVSEITRVLHEGYDAQILTRGLRKLMDELELDVLLIDTHPGLGEETLLSIIISHTLAIILRPDQQDYEGTDVTLQVARQLNVPNIVLIVNKLPSTLDSAAVKAQVEGVYGCPVVAVLPHSDEMMSLASGGIFYLHYPDHPLVNQYVQMTNELMK